MKTDVRIYTFDELKDMIVSNSLDYNEQLAKTDISVHDNGAKIKDVQYSWFDLIDEGLVSVFDDCEVIYDDVSCRNKKLMTWIDVM